MPSLPELKNNSANANNEGVKNEQPLVNMGSYPVYHKIMNQNLKGKMLRSQTG